MLEEILFPKKINKTSFNSEVLERSFTLTLEKVEDRVRVRNVSQMVNP